MKRGLSLLEVLISMFVLTIGLLSVIALVPVGQSEMVKGGIADRTFAMGQACHHDARARGLLQPFISYNHTEYSMWYMAAGPTKVIRAGATNVPGQVYITSEGGISVAVEPDDLSPQPVVFDPLGVLENGIAVDRYPYDAPAFVTGQEPRSFRRLTYIARPMATDPVLHKSLSSPELLGLAREVFACHDDLMLELPGDVEQAPRSMFFGENLTPPNPAKRMFDPKYSWLITLVPGGGGRMTMSTVIYRARDLDMVTDPADPQRVYNERSVDINWGTGYGGGDVELVADDNKKLELKGNSWLLATGREKYVRVKADGSLDQRERLIGKWYRVRSVDETRRISATEFRQTVRLDGPDWNPGNVAATVVVDPKAAIFEGVVGVYERSIKLELNSLWMN